MMAALALRRSRLRSWLLGLGVLLPLAAWAQSCEMRFTLTFADQTRGCLTEFAVADLSPAGTVGTLRRAVPAAGSYALAASPAVPQCPPAVAVEVNLYGHAPAWGGTPEQRGQKARERCQKLLPAGTASECACQLILNDGASPLTRAEFARYGVPQVAPVAVAAPIPAPLAPEPAAARAAVEPPAQPAPAATVAAQPRAPAPAPPTASGDDVAELRRQLEQLKAQVAKAQQQPAAPPAPTEAPPPVRSRAVALVIGNAAYRHLGALANPRRDAMDMAAKLRSFGIEVDLLLDADRNALVKALADHQRKALDRDVNILYYAGHGLQVGGTNYIAPVDMLADGISAGYVKLNGVALADALEYLPARTRLVFLDACRDNPAARSLVATRSVAAPGLAPMAATSGTLISYATRDGAVAEDGQGRNSPYTAALLQHLSATDDIAVVLRRVRASVMQATANRQEPWEYGSLVGDQLVLPRLGR